MKLELKDIAVTVIGRLDGMSKTEAWAMIEAGGGTVRKTLSGSTDVLVMGQMLYEGDRLKNADLAARNHAVVLTQKQFSTLLEKGSITIREKKQKAVAMTTAEDSIAQFRGLLDEAPSTESWAQICGLLDKVPPDTLDIVVDYLVSHLAPYEPEWSDRHTYQSYKKRTVIPAFEPPELWLQALLEGQDSPKYRVLKKINVYNYSLTGKQVGKLIACPSLCHVTQLDLGKNKLSPSFYKQLGQCEHLSGLTHLRLERNQLEQKAMLGLVAYDNFPALKLLSLKDCGYKDSGILEALLGSDCLANLESFDVRVTRVEEDDLLALAKATQLTQLRELRLFGGYRLEGQCAADMLQASHFGGLEVLDLRGFERGGVCAGLAAATHLQQLKQLSIVRGFTTEGIRAFANAPHLASLISCEIDELDDVQRELLRSSPYLQDSVKESF